MLLITLALLSVALGAGGFSLWFFVLRLSSPLLPYSSLLPDDTVLVMHVNLAGLRETTAFDREIGSLNSALEPAFKNLELEPASAIVSSATVAVVKDGKTLTVWTFDQPVHFAPPPMAAFQPAVVAIVADDTDTQRQWAVDARGRLLSGPVELIKPALGRVDTGKQSKAFEPLAGVSGKRAGDDLLFWAAANFQSERGLAALLPRGTEKEMKAIRTKSFFLGLADSGEGDIAALGRVLCASDADASSSRTGLERLQTKLKKLPANPMANSLLPVLSKALATAHLTFVANESEVSVEGSLPISAARRVLDLQARNIVAARKTKEKEQAAEFKKRLDLGDKCFSEQRLEAAEKAYSDALKLMPGHELAEGKRNQVRTAIEKMAQFEAFARDTADALKKEDLNGAKESFHRARELRPMDPRVRDLEKQIGALQNRIHFKECLANGDKALESLELSKALDFFGEAEKTGLGALELKTRLVAAKAALEAQDSLRDAKGELAKRNFAQAYERVLRISERLFGETGKALEAHARLRALAKQMAAETAEMVSDILKGIRAPALAQKEAAKTAFQAMDYEEAAAQFRNAIRTLKKVKEFLPVVRKYPARNIIEETDREERSITDELDVLGKELDKTLAWQALKRGTELLAEGRTCLKTARRDAASLLRAQAAFDEAVRRLTIAKRSLAKEAAASLTEATKGSQRCANMMQPFDINLAAKLPDWDGVKGWKRSSGFGRSWCYAPDRASATLTSPHIDFPPEFSLEIAFAVVDESGQITNDWKLYPEMLTIKFAHKDRKKPLSISIGQDPSYKAERLPYVFVNGLGKHAGDISDVKEPVILRLVRSSRETALSINGKKGKTISKTISWDDDFSTITIQVRNAHGNFPAIFRMWLKMNPRPQKESDSGGAARRVFVHHAVLDVPGNQSREAVRTLKNLRESDRLGDSQAEGNSCRP